MKMVVRPVRYVDGANVNKIMASFISGFKNGARLEIVDESSNKNEYYVEFVDLSNGVVEYSTTIKANYWAHMPSNTQKEWLIRVTCNNEIVYERRSDKKFNATLIKITSASLGDTIAWIPYVEEYRKVSNTKVIVSTFHNYLFEKVYRELVFVNQNDADKIDEVDKRFKIDYYPLNFISDDFKKYNNVEYLDYRTIPMQFIASSILGLPNIEIKPKVDVINDNGPKIKGKYVVVAIQSTAQLKYWNNPFGWERLFDFLGRNGYKIVLIDRYKNFGVLNSYNQAPKSKYVIDKTGNIPLSERIIDIKYSKMMITISSGLAWLAWAIGTPVVMISGFTKPWCEFESNMIRIHNPNVCNGCWNDTSILFEKSEWLFCPRKKDFICSKSIQPKDVIDGVKKLM